MVRVWLRVMVFNATFNNISVISNVNIVDVRIGISFLSTYAMTDKHPDNFVQIVIDNSLELEDNTVFTQMFLSFNITTERLDKNITEDRHILTY
jgi:hypothetical protein